MEGDAFEVWLGYFRSNAPDPAAVRRLIRKFNNEQRHAEIIAVIQSALIHGQSQPWMYEVLALSMENEGYPAPEVERVVMSLADFGGADFEQMMLSAAYLARFGRSSSALRMYQQASRLLPERPEPYILGLRFAREQESVDDVEWAACGILRHCWTRDYQKHHQDAEDAALVAAGWLRRRGDEDRLESFSQTIGEARRRDLVIRLEWNGNADLDLYVEEPSGTVCSFMQRDSPGGGVLVHDGFGPRPENCYESYVCALGLPGDYRIRVKHAWGTIVGGRATLTITQHAGTPQAETTTHVLVVDGGESTMTLHLAEGRRTAPKMVAALEWAQSFELPQRRRPASVRGSGGKVDLVSAEFVADHLPGADRMGPARLSGAGVVGYQSVIQLIPQGASLSAAAVVSADRRYVRIGVVPLFSTITDVFTFTFIGGGGQGTGGGAGQNAP